jgi:putative chitinase
MTITLTVEQIKEIVPTATQVEEWCEVFNNNFSDAEIDTNERIAAFIAQSAVESQCFTHLHENLNYRAESLLKLWPKHFTVSQANECAHNPEKIANRAYANRNGNGDETSGDGYKYRGRGLLQITGKANYALCSQYMYGDDTLVQQPELLETDMDVAVSSALWFWSTHKLNNHVDANNFKMVTQKINGGQTGAAEREEYFHIALTVLQQG